MGFHGVFLFLLFLLGLSWIGLGLVLFIPYHCVSVLYLVLHGCCSCFVDRWWWRIQVPADGGVWFCVCVFFMTFVFGCCWHVFLMGWCWWLGCLGVDFVCGMVVWWVGQFSFAGGLMVAWRTMITIGLATLMSFAIGRWVLALFECCQVCECVGVWGSVQVVQVLIVSLWVIWGGRIGYRIFRSFVSYTLVVVWGLEGSVWWWDGWWSWWPHSSFYGFFIQNQVTRLIPN